MSQRRNIQHLKIIPSFHAEIEWIPYFSSHEVPESLIGIKVHCSENERKIKKLPVTQR